MGRAVRRQARRAARNEEGLSAAGGSEISLGFLGSGEFDPEKVGLNTRKETPGNTFEFRTRSDNGLEILGNANTGHIYGTDMTHEERMDLIAFLKTL